MAEKPSYLKLLNGISCAETRAFQYLSAWAEVTTDPDVRAVLHTVAAREGEHGMAFAKRVNELGFELQTTDDPKFAERMEIAGSDRPDLEKAELLGVLEYATAPDAPDIFDSFFRDHTIDIQTGELLGRYIAEERDTIRLLQGCRGAAGVEDMRHRRVARPARRARGQDRRGVSCHRRTAPDRLCADDARTVQLARPDAQRTSRSRGTGRIAVTCVHRRPRATRTR